MIDKVAPRAGAWIETHILTRGAYPEASHPVRVRGLKPNGIASTGGRILSHPVRVRGLKQRQKD